MLLLDESGACSCETVDVNFEGALDRLAALAASNALQSRSVLPSRGDSTFGVRGDGEPGRDVPAEPGRELIPLPSGVNSELIRGERDSGVGPRPVEFAGETPREDA